MVDVDKIKQLLYDTYCDPLDFTPSDLDNVLLANRIDITSYTNLSGGNTLRDYVRTVGTKSRSLVDDIAPAVARMQYVGYVQEEITRNLSLSFSSGVHSVFKRDYKAREARLLAASLAPALAAQYLQNGIAYNTGVNRVKKFLKINERKISAVISEQLDYYYRYGYMPARDENLNIKQGFVPVDVVNSGGPTGHGDKLSHSLGGRTVFIGEIFPKLKGLPRDSAVNLILSQYPGSTLMEARDIYSEVLTKTRTVALIREPIFDSDGKFEGFGDAMSVPVATSKRYSFWYLYNFITDSDKRRRSQGLFFVPHSWRIASEIGFLRGLGLLENNRTFYESRFLKRIIHDSTRDAVSALGSTVSSTNINKFAGREFSSSLFDDSVVSLPIFFDNFQNKTAQENMSNARPQGRGFWKFLRRIKKNKFSSHLKKASPPKRFKKKKTISKLLDFFAASPALIAYAFRFILGKAVQFVDARLFKGEFLKSALVRVNSGGSLTDRFLMGVDSFKFGMNGLKLILKDGVEASIPALALGIVMGSAPLGIIVGSSLFAIKFVPDFVEMFNAQSPLTANIIRRAISTIADTSFSAEEIMAKTGFFGIEMAVPTILLGSFLGVGAVPMLAVIGGGMAIRAVDLMGVGRSLFAYGKAVEDLGMARYLFKMQNTIEFGSASLLPFTVLAIATHGIAPLSLIIPGVGLTTGAISDFFKNSVFNETVINSAVSGVDASRFIAAGGGLGLIGFSLLGPVGAAIGVGLGITSSAVLSYIQHVGGRIVVPRVPTEGLTFSNPTEFNQLIHQNLSVYMSSVSDPLALTASELERVRFLLNEDLMRLNIPAVVSEDAVREFLNAHSFMANPELNTRIEELRLRILEGYRNDEFLRIQQQGLFRIGRITDLRNFDFARYLSGGRSIDEVNSLLSGLGFDSSVLTALSPDIHNLVAGSISPDVFKDRVAVVYEERLRDFGFSSDDIERFLSGKVSLFEIKNINPSLRVYLRLSDSIKNASAIDFVDVSKLKDAFVSLGISGEVETLDAFRQSLSAWGIDMSKATIDKFDIAFLKGNSIDIVSKLSRDSFLKFLSASDATKISEFLDPTSVNLLANDFVVNGEHIFSVSDLTGGTSISIKDFISRIDRYVSSEGGMVNLEHVNLFEGSKMFDLLKQLNSVVGEAGVISLRDLMNLDYVTKNALALKDIFLPTGNISDVGEIVSNLGNLGLPNFIDTILKNPEIYAKVDMGSLFGITSEQGRLLFAEKLSKLATDRGIEVGFLNKLGNYFRNLKPDGVVSFSAIKDMPMTAIWGIVVGKILGLSTPLAALVGLGTFGARYGLEFWGSKIGTKVEATIPHAIGVSMDWGLAGFVIGSIFGGPLIGLAVGGGTLLAASLIRYYYDASLAKIGIFKWISESWATVGKVGEGAFEIGSLVQETSESPKLLAQSLLFKNGILQGIFAWINTGFAAAGAYLLGGLIGVALGVAGTIAAVPALVAIGIGIAATSILVVINRVFHINLWQLLVVKPAQALFGWIGRTFLHSIASVGFDIVIGMMMLFFRFDFDIEQFLKTILIYVVSWSAISSGIFGAGMFGSGNNSGTADTVNSSPSTSSAIGLVTSPVNGSILNLTSDNVTVKTQNGNVIVIKNINNPYLYVGEGIYKGEVVSTSK